MMLPTLINNFSNLHFFHKKEDTFWVYKVFILFFIVFLFCILIGGTGKQVPEHFLSRFYCIYHDVDEFNS